jgi:hypothetical protein
MFELRARVETSYNNCEAAEFIGTCLEYLREFRYFFKENLVNSSSYSGSGIRKIAEVKNPNKFSILADRNPDIIFVDQLATVLRYVYKKGTFLCRLSASFQAFLTLLSMRTKLRECL